MKIIIRIKGGLGNQLFCYAAARRLSIINKSELILDDVTGFARDHQYRRQFALNHFHISCRKATPKERMEPFERYRRGIMKWLSRRQPFTERRYVEQEGNDFDVRLLNLTPQELIYLDGLWQSEAYFKDIEQTIRDDLRIIPPTDALNQRMAEEIRNCNAVALHVRWYESPGNVMIDNISADYYQRAIALIEGKYNSPRYFLFSDAPEDARAKLVLPEGRVTFVSHNKGDENAYADLWLMTQCRHFITANSTFSWWGAWLSSNADKIVITPRRWFVNETNTQTLIPQSWVRL
jgi:hypothetical protein